MTPATTAPARRPLTNTERTARYQERYRRMKAALHLIRTEARTAREAREIAADALDESKETER